MKTTRHILVKAFILFTCLFGLSSYACSGDPTETNSADSIVVAATDTSITDVIDGLWWDDGLGEGGLTLRNTHGIELNIEYKNDSLVVNPEVKDIFIDKSPGHVPNSKYLDKKVKITYWRQSVIGQPKVHHIKTIEVLDEEVLKAEPISRAGIITGVTTQDSTCIILQSGYDEPVVDVYRLYRDEQNYFQVNLDGAKDIFTHKNYSTQLNPKYVNSKVNIVLEKKIVTNISIFPGTFQKRTEVKWSYVVTRIEFAK